jgi:hypothetical protein
MLTQIILMALASSVAAGDIGTEPTMEEFVAIAEPALAAEMRDASTLKLKWPYRLKKGPAGYYTCGKVESYKGKPPKEEIWVSAVVANGRAINSQWSTKNGMLAWQCKKLVKSGELVAR